MKKVLLGVLGVSTLLMVGSFNVQAEERYRMRCDREAIQNSNKIDIELSAELVVKKKNEVFELQKLESHVFAYDPELEKNVTGIKRPQDAFYDFTYAMAKKVKQDAKYNPRKYKDHVRFQLDFKGTWAQFVFPKNFVVFTDRGREHTTANFQILGPNDHWGASLDLECSLHPEVQEGDDE